MNEKSTKITDLMALLLFGMFAVCVLFVLLTGANSYQQLVNAGNESYARRTLSQYVLTRARQAEQLTVEVFGGCETLVGMEEIDGERFLTRVYCYDGYLRELFSEADSEFLPEDGEKVLPAENASFELGQGMLTIRIDGQEMTMALRAEREVAP